MTDQDAKVIPLRPGSDVEEWRDPAGDLAEMPGAMLPVVDVSIVDTPIVPGRAEIREWLSDCYWGARLTARRWVIRFVRSPVYYLRAVRYAPRGLWVTAGVWWRWVRDVEGMRLRMDVAADRSLDAAARERRWQAAYDARKVRVRWRWGVTLTLTLAVAVAARWLSLAHPWWARGVMAVTVLVFGLVGARRGQIVTPVHTPVSLALTSDAVVAAFTLAKITKPEVPVTVIGVPHLVGGGWLATVELPGGITYDDVIAKRVPLASGLNVARDCLHLDPLPTESERRVAVFVSTEHPHDVPVPAWPLLDVDRWDIWRPIPIGWDPQGRVVAVSLLWLHTLIGAAPQRGKTSMLRLLAIACLLDPRVDVIVVNFKGGTDWTPFAAFCLRFINGQTPEDLEEFAALIGWLETQRARRMQIIEAAGTARAPQGRLTPAMAEDPDLGMRPLVVIADEIQVITEDRALRKLVAAWSQLMRLCPAAGIEFVAATQNPSATSVPSDLARIFLQRVAMSVQSRLASEAVLGTEAYREGLNAAALGGRPGLGIMWAQAHEDGDGYRGKLRIPDCTPAQAEVMLQRVARLRRTVTAQPAQVRDELQTPEVVRRVLAAWPHGEVAEHQETLAARIGWDKKRLGDELRALGLPGRQTKVAGVNRTGYYLADVQRLADDVST